FERDRAALDAGLVADFDVPARHAGVAAHGAAILFRGFVVLQHRLDDEGGQVALLGVGGAAQPVEIVVGNFDRGLGHQRFGRALDRCDRDHVVAPYSAAAVSSVSPGRTWVKRTGSRVIVNRPDCWRATVNHEAAMSPGAGKSARKWAPRE